MRGVWRLHVGRLILLLDRRWPIAVVIRTNSNRLVVAPTILMAQSRMEIKRSLLKVLITTMGEDVPVLVV